MKTEKRKLADLKPLDRNVRMHNQIQVKEMVRAVERFGQTRPMVIDEEGNVLIGNCLYIALVEMGRKDGDCYVVKGLSEREKKKLILSDNKLYRLGSDNFETIDEFLKDIASEGDFEIPGFDVDVVKRLFDDVKEIDTKIQDYGNVNPQSFAVPREDEQTQTPLAPPEDTAEAPQEDRKFIICPKCGEMIYLD